MAGLALAGLVGLLTAVALGKLYAVEAAATGALVLLVIGVTTGRLTWITFDAMLTEAMQSTGALFAPLLAATTFTLVLRTLGTDKLVAAFVTGLPGGPLVAVCVVLGVIALSALVLDAFEIIFVVVPIVIPALLMRVPDAMWISALVLLTLQASFLLPPAGYALLMARTATGITAPIGAVVRALAPFLAAQLAVVALVLAEPRLVHLTSPTPLDIVAPASQAPEDAARRLRDQLPPPPDFGASPFGSGPAK